MPEASGANQDLRPRRIPHGEDTPGEAVFADGSLSHRANMAAFPDPKPLQRALAPEREDYTGWRAGRCVGHNARPRRSGFYFWSAEQPDGRPVMPDYFLPCITTSLFFRHFEQKNVSLVTPFVMGIALVHESS